MVNYVSLQYLLNEVAAYAIRSNMSKVDENQTKGDYLKNIDEVKNPKTLSYINKIGFNVGYKSTELLLMDPSISTTSLTNLSNNALIENPLEAMKFICRDVWKNIFGKQMDNLRTNHVGTFVLVDHKPISYYNCYYTTSTSTSTTGEHATVKRAAPFLEFNVGLIYGVLACLGVVNVSVTASPIPVTDDTNQAGYEKVPGSDDVIHNSVQYTVETKN